MLLSGQVAPRKNHITPKEELGQISLHNVQDVATVNTVSESVVQAVSRENRVLAVDEIQCYLYARQRADSRKSAAE